MARTNYSFEKRKKELAKKKKKEEKRQQKLAAKEGRANDQNQSAGDEEPGNLGS